MQRKNQWKAREGREISSTEKKREKSVKKHRRQTWSEREKKNITERAEKDVENSSKQRRKGKINGNAEKEGKTGASKIEEVVNAKAKEEAKREAR